MIENAVKLPSQSDWVLTDHRLSPTHEDSFTLHDWLFERTEEDLPITFNFSQHDAQPIKILSSRLEAAGGPLAALANQPFSERHNRRVDLSIDDDPQTFSVVRHFLYRKPLSLVDGGLMNVVNLDSITRVICAAHRWQLGPLFRAFALLVKEKQLLNRVEDVITAIQFIELPKIPRSVLVYFWACVGRYYHQIRVYQNMGNKSPDEHDKEGINTGNTEGAAVVRSSSEIAYPLFPNIWEIAASQGMAEVVLQGIITNNHEARRNEGMESTGAPVSVTEIEHLILSTLEPLIPEDDKVIELLSQVPWSISEMKQILADRSIYTSCSTRSICLLNRVILSLRVPRNEYRFSYKLNMLTMNSTFDITKNFRFPLPDSSSIDELYRDYNSTAETIRVAPQCDNSIILILRIKRDYEGLQVTVDWLRSDTSKIEEVVGYSTTVELISDGCVCIESQQPEHMSIKEQLLRKEIRLIDSRGSLSIGLETLDVIRYSCTHKEKCSMSVSLMVWEQS